MTATKTLKNLLLSASLLAATAFASGASAQSATSTTVPGAPTAAMAASGATAAAGDMTEGEVRKVDKPAGKITLRHGEIRNLDMPGMTMVFQARNPAPLASLKVGDKVRFRAEKAGAALVVTDIQPVK